MEAKKTYSHVALFWKVIIVLLLCLGLVGCGTQGGVSNTHDPENDTQGTVGAELDEAKPDLELLVTEISLSDMEDSCVLLVSDETGNSIYRMYCDSYAHIAYIERYEMETVTAEFLTGGKANVKSAIKNTINEYDYHIFETRFLVLHNDGKTKQLEKVTDQWQPGNTVWVLRTEDMECLLTEDAQGLWLLMKMLFEDRGTGKQHFGPTQS